MDRPAASGYLDAMDIPALPRILALLALLALPGTGAAQSIVSTGQSFVSARLLAGYTEPDGTRVAGLRLAMAPGWKTYWRSPGEAGVPPRFDWSGSRNLRTVEVLWPAPEVFESFGMTTIGYGGEVVLPLRVTPADEDAPVELALSLNLGVCRDICVMEQATLDALLVPGLDGAVEAVRASVEAVPAPAADRGLLGVACRIEGAGKTRRFEARLDFETPPAAPMVVLEGEDLWFYGAETAVEGDGVVVTAKLDLPSPAAWVSRKAIRMTVLGEGYAADVRGC